MALLPQDVESERALLDILLTHPARLPEVAAFLDPAHFWCAAHRRLYEALQALEAAGAPFVSGDPSLARFLVAQWLREHDQGRPDEAVTAANAIPWELLGLAGAGSQARWFAERVYDCYARRRAMQAMQAGLTEAQDDSAEAAQLVVEEAFRELAENERRLRGGGVETELDLLAAEQREPDRAAAWHVPCGLRWLDQRTGGLVPGRVWVVSAYTGIGKTWLASALKVQLLNGERRVLDISLEMTASDTVLRLLASQAAVSVAGLRRPYQLSSEGQQRVAAATAWLREQNDAGRYRLFTSQRRLSDLVRLIRAERPDAVVIDFVQDLQRERGADRYEHLTDACQVLQSLCQERGREFVLILCSQISNDAYHRQREDPWFLGNKETGQIGINADLNLLLMREQEAESPGGDQSVPLTLAVQKNRHGPGRQRTVLRFNPVCGQFREG